MKQPRLLSFSRRQGRRVLRAFVFSVVVLMPFSTSFAADEADVVPRRVCCGYPVDYYDTDSAWARQTVGSTDIHHTPLAERALQRKDWDTANRELALIVGERIPNHPRALRMLIQLNRQRPHPKAEAWLIRAVAINPNISTSHVILGTYLHSANRLSEAEKAYARAIELDPPSINANYNMGLLLTDLKRYEDANRHAQVAYAGGVGVQGLRKRLEAVGAWRPIERSEDRRADQ